MTTPVDYNYTSVSVDVNSLPPVASKAKASPETQAKHITIGRIFALAAAAALVCTAGKLFSSYRSNEQIDRSNEKMGFLPKTCFTVDTSLPIYAFAFQSFEGEETEAQFRVRVATEGLKNLFPVQKNVDTGTCDLSVADVFNRLTARVYAEKSSKKHMHPMNQKSVKFRKV